MRTPLDVMLLAYVLLSVSIASVRGADTVTCSFECRKHMTRAEAANSGLPPHSAPMSDCHVYCFWARGQGASREFMHFADSPAKTDGKGICTYPFIRKATYYVYFSGRELTALEVRTLAEKRSHVLLRVGIQPRSSLSDNDTQPEVVEYQRNRLKVTIRQSFSRWISLLHRVETQNAQPANVLTSVRKLLYDDDNWNTLVDRANVPALIEFDKSTGMINVLDGHDFDTLEALSDRFELKSSEPLQYALSSDQAISYWSGLPIGPKYRRVLERNEFVTLPDGRTVQIFHVLAGIEAQLFGPSQNLATALKLAPNDTVAAATWSGDLAQAACLLRPHVAAEAASFSKEWKSALDQKSPSSELIGDIAGIYVGESGGKSLQNGVPLSQVLEDAFHDKKWAGKAVSSFKQRYPDDRKNRFAIEDFAVRWCGSLLNKAGWYFDKGGAIEERILDQSIDELERILKEMSATDGDAPDQASQLYYLRDIRSGVGFEGAYKDLRLNPAGLAEAKQTFSRFFASELPNGIFSSLASVSQFHSRARLPKDQETFLELMNLAIIEEELIKDGTGSAVKSNEVLIRNTLFQTTEHEGLINTVEVQSRLKSLERLRTLCLRGVDPVFGPTAAEADQQLIAAGLPNEWPRETSHPRKMSSQVGNRTDVYWVVDVDVDLGLGNGREKLIRNLPVAIHESFEQFPDGKHYSVGGFLREAKAIAVDLDSRLAAIGRERRTLQVGKTVLLLKELEVFDGQLYGDWELTLPGESPTPVTLRRIQPQVSQGRFLWFAPIGPKELPPMLGSEQLPANRRSIVDFGGHRPSSVFLAASQGVSDAAGETSALLDNQPIKCEPAISNFEELFQGTDTPGIPLMEIPDGEPSFLKLQPRHHGPAISQEADRALQQLTSELQADASKIRDWKSSLDEAELTALKNMSPSAEVDCIMQVNGRKLRVGPVIVLTDGTLIRTRRDVAAFVGVESVRVVRSVRKEHKVVTDTLKELQESLRVEPTQILEWPEEPIEPDKNVICVAEVVLNCSGGSYAIGPIYVTRVQRDKVAVNARRSSVHKLVKNLDTLTHYVEKSVPFFTPAGSLPEVAIQNVDLQLREGNLSMEVKWSSQFLRHPVFVDLQIPLSEGGTFDGVAAVRQALSHEEVVFGPHLSVKFDDLLERDDWPAVIAAGNSKISVLMNFANGNWTLELTANELQPLLPSSLTQLLTGAGVSTSPRIKDVRLNVPDDGHSAAVVAKLQWDIEGDSLDVDVRIDQYGMHIGSWEGIASQLVRHVVQNTGDWPVRVSRISIAGNELRCDAELLIGASPALSLYGVTFKDGTLNCGAVEVSPEFAKLWIDGANLDAIQFTNIRFDKRGVICDATFDLPPFETMRMKDIPLGGGKDRVDALLAACTPQVILALKPSKTVGFGVFAITAKPAPDAHSVSFSAELKDPKIVFLWPSAEISTHGMVFGRGQLVEPREPELKRQLSPLFEQAASVNTGTVSVDSAVIIGEDLSDLGVEFTVSVNLPNGMVTIRGNKLTAAGITLGELPDLKDVAKAAVNEALDNFASWVVGTEIPLGVAAVRVTKADVQSRTAEGVILLQNREVGGVLAKFTDSGRPAITLKDPEQFLSNVAALTPLSTLPESRGKAFRANSTNLAKNSLIIGIEFLVPILDEYVQIGAIVVNSDGVRFDAESEWEMKLWTSVATKLSGKSFKDESLPVSLTVAKATVGLGGLTLDLKCNIDGLGEFSLTGVRLDRKGLQIDEQAVLTNIAALVTAKVQEALGDAVCTLAGIEAVGDVIEVSVVLSIDGLDPFPFKVKIGKDGSLRGFDEHALLAPVLAKVLNHIASELEGKSFELPGDIRLTVAAASPAADLKGINVSGTISAFEAVAATVENIVFTGRSFDTSQMKLADFKVEGLSEALGLADLGDNGVSIKNFGPMFGENNRLTGVTLTASCKIAEVLEAEVNASIGQNGIKVQLPITLVANGVTIPVPPCFALSRWKAQIAETHLGVGCSLGLAIPKSEKLIRVDGLLKFPLKPPRQISAEGDLVLVSFLRPGHSEVIVDLDASEFRALMTIDLFRVMSFDGRFLARLTQDEFLLEGNGELIFLGSTLASGYMKIDAVVFVGHGQLSILGVKAKAGLDGKWEDVLDTTVTAEVGFDLPLVGRIVGSDVKGNPKKGAEFGATILSRRIQLAAMDFQGLTKERILDLLYQDSIIPTGLKLLAAEGGGGSVFVARDGSLVKVNPDTGEFTAVTEMNNTLVLRRGSVDTGGNPDDTADHVITEEIVNPSTNQIVRIVRNAKGQEIVRPTPRPYVPGTAATSTEPVSIPDILPISAGVKE